MSNLIITVKRYDQLQRYPELSGAAFSDAMTVAVNAIVRDTQTNSPVDRGFIRASWAGEVDDDNPLKITGRVFSSSPHAPIIEGVDEAGNPVEFGRRPGAKMPPISVIRVWVERHNIGAEVKAKVLETVKERRKWGLKISGVARKQRQEDALDRVAFLVARKIARDGIKPTRPLARAVEANRAFVQRTFDEAADRLARLIEGGR